MTLLPWLREICRPLFADELARLRAAETEVAALQQQVIALSQPSAAPAPVEVVQEVPVIPKEFPDETQMRDWFRACPVRLQQYQATTFDCDDFARKTQQAALADGWLVNFQVDQYGDYCNGHAHFLCNAVVGNWSIIMEPQTGEEVGRLRID